MIRKVIISSFLNQILVGIVEDHRLAEFFLEKDENSRTIGNIYKGKIENVLPGISAAFVDLGLERNGFLYVDDVKTHAEDRPINELVKRGQEVLVQVSKEPEGRKGARVVSQISLPGRYLVLMPFDESLGVSRQITDARERARLREIGSQLTPPGMGLIVRTVAEGHDYEDLAGDLDELVKLWNDIISKSKRKSAPVLLHYDHDLIYRIMRDVVTEDIDTIIVDQPWIYDRIISITDKLDLNPATKIKLYDGEVALFEELGLSKDLEKATKKQVWLNSGGYLVIDQTEALVSIDVNTGKYVGSNNLKETVLRTNKEAAEEIAKQLRLRNIGGIIIIDFIDMDDEQDKQDVLEVLSQALAKDKTKSHVLGFTRLGLVEMTRKKAKTRLSHILETVCPHCRGTGRVFSQDTIAINLAQRICSLAREPEVKSVKVECHPLVAAKLIGKKKENLKLLEKRTNKEILVAGDDQFELDEIEVSLNVDKD